MGIILRAYKPTSNALDYFETLDGSRFPFFGRRCSRSAFGSVQPSCNVYNLTCVMHQRQFMKNRLFDHSIFFLLTCFTIIVFADSCSKNNPSGPGNQRVCVTRLSPNVGDYQVSNVDLDSIYTLFSANNLSAANLQFQIWETDQYSGYQEQVTAVQFFNGLPVFGNEIFVFNAGLLAPGGILGSYTGPAPSADTAGHQNYPDLRNAFLAHVSESFTEGGAAVNSKPFVPSASTYVNACLNATLGYMDASAVRGSTAAPNDALVKVWYITPSRSTSITYYPLVYVEDDNGFAWGHAFSVP